LRNGNLVLEVTRFTSPFQALSVYDKRQVMPLQPKEQDGAEYQSVRAE
jgi:hypothetical protein